MKICRCIYIVNVKMLLHSLAAKGDPCSAPGGGGLPHLLSGDIPLSPGYRRD